MANLTGTSGADRITGSGGSDRIIGWSSRAHLRQRPRCTAGHAEAVTWYRKAADQGLAGAQSNLGGMYEKGQGVPQDYAEAANWYRKAGHQGLAEAQNNLGLMPRSLTIGSRPSIRACWS
jgi:TPR repeat protein